jgi:hypothetical protein
MSDYYDLEDGATVEDLYCLPGNGDPQDYDSTAWSMGQATLTDEQRDTLNAQNDKATSDFYEN